MDPEKRERERESKLDASMWRLLMQSYISTQEIIEPVERGYAERSVVKCLLIHGDSQICMKLVLAGFAGSVIQYNWGAQ